MQPNSTIAEQIFDGRYKVLEHLADGGCGSVYIVENIFMHKQWAMKVLDQKLVSSTQVRRFQAEAKLMARLNHPNIVQAVDFGICENDQPYFIMELLTGKTVAHYIKKNGAFESSDAIAIIIATCKALSYAHALNVVHRDIKPSNLMLDTSSGKFEPKILDFGIAQLTDDEQMKLTVPGEIFGSPAYMSPEQCSAQSVDLRSDIYSLGCSFFEMLTGATPFQGKSMLETMMMHKANDAPSLKEGSLGKKFSPSLEKIIKKMMAKDVENRYQNCDEIISDLSQLSPDGSGSHFESKVRVVQADAQSPSTSKQTILLVVLSFLLVAAGSTYAMSELFWHSPKKEMAAKPSAPVESPAINAEIAENNSNLSQPTVKIAPADPVNDKKFPLFMRSDGWLNIDFGPTSMGSVSVDLADGRMVDREAQGKFRIPLDAKLSLETSVDYINHHPQSIKNCAPDKLYGLTLLAPFDGVMWMDDTASDKNLNAEARQAVASLVDLQKLRLKSVTVGNQLEQLGVSHMSRLRDLDLRNSDVSGDQIAPRKYLEQLTFLRLEKAFPCHSLVKALTKTAIIGDLHLIACDLTNDDLTSIGALKKITSLEIRNNKKLTNECLKNILPLRYLKNLDISDTSITPDCSSILTQLPALTTIVVKEEGQYTKEVWEKRFPTKYTLQFKR